MASRTAWLCRCRCGSEKIVEGSNLRSGRSTSCGCLRTELQTKHGLWTDPRYCAYYAMLRRCYNPNHSRYADYGGRGIAVCQRWRESLEVFAADVGPRPAPGYSLDRIDNDGNYEPDNVRWATAAEQIANQRIHRPKRRAKNNTTGFTGVFFENGRWRARLRIGTKMLNLGSYSNRDDAIAARIGGLIDNDRSLTDEASEHARRLGLI
jgi:hypothetical protein